jgi:hypothetical protein
MKFRIEVVIEEEAGQQQRIVVMEKHCGSPDASLACLGLTLWNGKALLRMIQQHLIETEVQAISRQQANCPACATPLKRKVARLIVYGALFGEFSLPNERFFAGACSKDEGKKSFSPLTTALSMHTHPELRNGKRIIGGFVLRFAGALLRCPSLM